MLLLGEIGSCSLLELKENDRPLNRDSAVNALKTINDTDSGIRIHVCRF